jgi:hypothetical protein
MMMNGPVRCRQPQTARASRSPLPENQWLFQPPYTGGTAMDCFDLGKYMLTFRAAVPAWRKVQMHARGAVKSAGEAIVESASSVIGGGIDGAVAPLRPWLRRDW